MDHEGVDEVLCPDAMAPAGIALLACAGYCWWRGHTVEGCKSAWGSIECNGVVCAPGSESGETTCPWGW